MTYKSVMHISRMGVLALPLFNGISLGQNTVQAARSEDFVQSLGVMTHLGATDGPYGNVANVQKSLTYLGFSHVRDQTPPSWILPTYQTLASSGIKFDMISAIYHVDLNVAQTAALLDTMENSRPGSVFSIEAPNEGNDGTEDVTFNGQSAIDPAVGIKIMQALYAGVKADSILAKKPVINLSIGQGAPNWEQYVSSLGDVSAYVDQANWHVYFSHGVQPATEVARQIKLALESAPGKPVSITETGYFTAPSDTSGWGGVDQATQAKETLNDVFDTYKSGVKQTYIYELLDEIENPSSSAIESNFGLFLADGTPKQAATAIHNLTVSLHDSDFLAQSFSPGGLSYSLSNLPDNSNSILLEKANGVYQLVLWAEPHIWDYDNRVEIAAPATHVIINFDTTPDTVQIIDPVLSSVGSAIVPSASISVALSDHPVVVQITSVAGPGTSNISTSGWYNLINQNSESCVDVLGRRTADGSAIGQWTCGTQSTNQEWQFEPTDSGYYTLKNRNAPSEAIDVNGRGTLDGSRIQLWSFWGGGNQQWMPVATDNGFYKFVGRESGRCLDVPSASKADGVQLQIYTCNGTGAQSFMLAQQP